MRIVHEHVFIYRGFVGGAAPIAAVARVRWTPVSVASFAFSSTGSYQRATVSQSRRNAHGAFRASLTS